MVVVASTSMGWLAQFIRRVSNARVMIGGSSPTDFQIILRMRWLILSINHSVQALHHKIRAKHFLTQAHISVYCKFLRET